MQVWQGQKGNGVEGPPLPRAKAHLLAVLSLPHPVWYHGAHFSPSLSPSVCVCGCGCGCVGVHCRGWPWAGEQAGSECSCLLSCMPTQPLCNPPRCQDAVTHLGGNQSQMGSPANRCVASPSWKVGVLPEPCGVRQGGEEWQLFNRGEAGGWIRRGNRQEAGGGGTHLKGPVRG